MAICHPMVLWAPINFNIMLPFFTVAALKFTEYNPDSLNYCSNKKEALEVEGKIYALAQNILVNKRCGETICDRIIYKSRLTWLSERTLSSELKEYGAGWYIIWPFYSSLYVDEIIETWLFDFESALVAVGGCLGLFLGWSLNSMILEPLEFLKDKLKK